MVEKKLYKLADEPDLPPAKKAAVMSALTKLSVKYRPYLDALAGQDGQHKAAAEKLNSNP
jgi:hypothetical protein